MIEITRWCRKCGINNKGLQFYKLERMNNQGYKKWYTENICMLCKREEWGVARRKYREKNRSKEIIRVNKWKEENKEKVNSYRRERRKKIKQKNII